MKRVCVGNNAVAHCRARRVDLRRIEFSTWQYNDYYVRRYVYDGGLLYVEAKGFEAFRIAIIRCR